MEPLKYEARKSATIARRKQDLIPEPCFACGSENDLHMHHENYDMALDIVWLCGRCHRFLHGKRGDAVVKKMGKCIIFTLQDLKKQADIGFPQPKPINLNRTPNKLIASGPRLRELRGEMKIERVALAAALSARRMQQIEATPLIRLNSNVAKAIARVLGVPLDAIKAEE